MHSHSGLQKHKNQNRKQEGFIICPAYAKSKSLISSQVSRSEQQSVIMGLRLTVAAILLGELLVFLVFARLVSTCFLG